jgi:hypothetical protein
VLVFRLVEELISLALKHGGLGGAAVRAMSSEVHWAVVGVLTLWILSGLYCLAAELVRTPGPARVKESLWVYTPPRRPWGEDS